MMADEQSQAAIIDDWLAGNYVSFEEQLARAGEVRGGYWPFFVTLAWVASRDEVFTAASQLFERETLAGRGSYHYAGAWEILSKAASRLHSRTLAQAESDLRLALETGALIGGQARDLAGKLFDGIGRGEWTRWAVVYDNHGISLLPGLYHFQWPSDLVRQAFPPPTAPATNQAAALPSQKRLANKPGPKPRFTTALRKIFKAHHNRMTEMSQKVMHQHVNDQWPLDGGKKVPSVRTVAAEWDKWLVERAEEARAEIR